MSADVAIRNARLALTGRLVDLEIAAGRIGAVVPAGHGGPAADELDAEGAVVLRGLWDRHVHSRQWALRRNSVDVSEAASAAVAAATIRGAVAAATNRSTIRAAAGDEVVLAYGARGPAWPDDMHKDLLAAVDRPVLVLTQDLHTAWLNQAALDRIGTGGHPSGVLLEHACFAAAAALTAAAEVERWITEAMHDAARLGVVGVLDFEMTDNVGQWSRRPPPPLRVVCSVPRDRFDAAVADGLRTGAPLDDPRLTVGPVKVFADGSLGSRTALCHAPYPGGAGGGSTADHGRREIDPDELAGLIAAARSHGLDVAVHAIGDAANTLALDAFARAGAGGRIEHAQLVADADRPRFAALGVVAGVQPAHLHDDRDTADRLWRGHTAGAYAYRSLYESGAQVEFGSDAPVTDLDPWRSITAAVTRAAAGRAPWHPEQRLGLAAALDCSARGRALPWVGDEADLVVIGAAWTVDAGGGTGPEGRPDVLATLCAGRWTHRR